MGGPEPSPDKTMAEIEIVDEDLGAPEDVAAEKAAADDIARLAPPRNRSEKVLAILSLSTGLLLYALDATMVSVAIPRMVADLGGADLLAWIGTAYLLTSTALSPLWGKIGDLAGRKSMLMLNTVIFILASIICALAQDMVTLIVGRAIQGIGAGGLQSLVYVIISDLVTLRERGTYQAVLGAIVGVGAICGPLLGGAITDSPWGWRGTFWVNLPVGGLALVGYAIFLRTPPAPANRSFRDRWTHLKSRLARIDYFGSVLCIVGVILFLLGLTWAATSGWGSAQALAPLIIGLAIFAGFIVFEAKIPKEPSVPPRLFKIRNISLAYLVQFFLGWAMQGGGYFFPLAMQLIYGASPTSAGLRMMPMVAVTIPSSIIAGIISSKTGKYVFFPKIGMAILSVAMGLASTWNPDTSLGQQIGYLCINGLGMGLVSSMIMLVVQANLPVIDLGPGTTVASFVRSVGGVVGIGIGGTIMQSIIGGQLNASSVIALSTQLGLSPMLVGGLIKEFAEGVTPPLPTGVSQSQFDTVARFTRQAYSDGLTKVFLSVAAATAVGWVFSMFITHANLRTSMGEKGADEGKDAAKGSEGDVEKGEAVQMAPVAAAQATPTIESENSEHETVEIEDDYPAQSTRASAPTNGTA